jgi:cytoskeletal protein RodZ
MNHQRNIKFLWIVIGVLFAGFLVLAIFEFRQTTAVQEARTYEDGDVASLKEQLRQAKSAPSPTTSPLSESTQNASKSTPTPSPTSLLAPVKTK